MRQQAKKNRRRILFVDDEPRVLDGLENVVFSRHREWHCDFAGGGVEALELMGRHAYDILVTDIRMPGMDGAELLGHVRDEHPAVVRVVLSGHCELEVAMRALPLAHQLLGKPCEPATLLGMLQRALEVQSLISEPEVRALLGKVSRLPMRPRIYHQLQTLLESETASLDDVAELISRDVGISSHLLHIANTAFFSRGRPATSLRQVVTRLGVNLVRELTLAAEMMGPLTKEVAGMCLDRQQQHSLECARLAAGHVKDAKLRDDAFLAGLLHDSGKLALAAALPETYADVLQKAAAEARPLSLVEIERFGVSHADVGAYLLGLWGVSFNVCNAVGAHNRPEEFARFEDESSRQLAQAICEAHLRMVESSEEVPRGSEVRLVGMGEEGEGNSETLASEEGKAGHG